MLRVNDVDVFDTAEELLDPKHTALLVIDMQNEMGSDKGGYAKNGYDISRLRSVIPAIQKVLEASRKLNLPIIYTEFIHRNRDGTTRMDGPNVYMHRKAHWISDVVEGAWEAKTLDELAPQPGDVVLQKSRGSAARDTELDSILKKRNIQCVVLTGCVSDGCVLSTAADMSERGYYCVVVTDAVESLGKENHDIGMKFIEIKFPVFSSDEIVQSWATRSKTQGRS